MTSLQVRRGVRPAAPGPADCYTGRVRIEHLFSAHSPARASGAKVRMEAGARSAWHSHPLGQTLVVLEGRGLVCRQDEPAVELAPGDTVWIPPDVRHWHGAAPDSPVTHLSVCEALDGRDACWMEKVTDREYLEPPAGRRENDI
ncbi:MAG: cupin domain-containing protein [Desulfovibrionaceae bacterium]|nr:cupin domain-containing protein [Desulfovibrionaceae bacterium]